jgi:hypothetical protein
MSYIRHDKDNNPDATQPSSTSITLYGGTEGWSAITYEAWNGDYVARNSDNTVRVPGTYQKHDKDNNPVTPATYQRHDKNNNPVLE